MERDRSYPPLTHPIAVVGRHYCVPHPLDLSVSDKAVGLTDSDYAVTDADANVVFQVKGKLLSLRDKHLLLDAAGNPLLTLQQKVMTAHRRWQVFRGESTDSDDLLFSAKKASMLQSSKTELDVFLASNTSEDACDFSIKGSFMERTCTIYQGNANFVIAQVCRRCAAKNIVPGRDAFGVTVYPNVDYAFIVALLVILEEIHKDRDGRD